MRHLLSKLFNSFVVTLSPRMVTPSIYPISIHSIQSRFTGNVGVLTHALSSSKQSQKQLLSSKMHFSWFNLLTGESHWQCCERLPRV